MVSLGNTLTRRARSNFCSMISQCLFVLRALAALLVEGRVLRDRLIAAVHAGALALADLTRPSTAVAGTYSSSDFILQADEVDFLLNVIFFAASAALFTTGWICAIKFTDVARVRRHGRATTSVVKRSPHPSKSPISSPRASTPPTGVAAKPGRALRRALTDPPSPLPGHVQQLCFPVRVLGDRDAPSANGK